MTKLTKKQECIPKGTKLTNAESNNYLKVMAYSDGYYMLRFKGCMPFVKSKKDLITIIAQRGYVY